MSQLDTPTVQKRGGADNDCIGGIVTHCLEGCINLRNSVRIVNLDLQSHRASGGFYVLQLSVSGTCIRWINDYAYPRDFRQQIMEHLQPLCSRLGGESIYSGQVAIWSREARSQALCSRLGGESIYSGQVAIWSREARSQAKLHRIGPEYEDYRYGRRCRLGSQRRRDSSGEHRGY